MPRLPVTKLWARLEQGQVDLLYLLCGEETLLRQEYTATLVKRSLGIASPDFNCDTFTATSDTLPEALGIAQTLPMMASHRVVVLHGVQQLGKDEWFQLERYAEQPVESTVLICTSTESEEKKCPPTFWQRALVVECRRLEGTQLQEWMAARVGQNGCHITAEALRSLLQDQEHDLQMLSQELEKLCIYVGGEGVITLDDVQLVSQGSRLHSIFALADALGTRQVLPAFAMVNGLLHQGEPPLVIFSMIVRHLRLLWSIKQFEGQRLAHAHIAKTLRIPPPVCQRLTGQSRRFSGARLQRLYEAALEADIAFKTTNRPPRTILESLILACCVGS